MNVSVFVCMCVCVDVTAVVRWSRKAIVTNMDWTQSSKSKLFHSLVQYDHKVLGICNFIEPSRTLGRLLTDISVKFERDRMPGTL